MINTNLDFEQMTKFHFSNGDVYITLKYYFEVDSNRYEILKYPKVNFKPSQFSMLATDSILSTIYNVDKAKDIMKQYEDRGTSSQ